MCAKDPHDTIALKPKNNNRLCSKNWLDFTVLTISAMKIKASVTAVIFLRFLLGPRAPIFASLSAVKVAEWGCGVPVVVGRCMVGEAPHIRQTSSMIECCLKQNKNTKSVLCSKHTYLDTLNWYQFMQKTVAELMISLRYSAPISVAISGASGFLFPCGFFSNYQ